MILKGLIFLVGRLGLLLKQLIFNSSQLVKDLGFGFAPPAQISDKESSFLSERSRGRALPTFLSNRVVILFHNPPIFETKRFVGSKSFGIKNRKNRSVVAAKHRHVIDRRIWKRHTPFCIA